MGREFVEQDTEKNARRAAEFLVCQALHSCAGCR